MRVTQSGFKNRDIKEGKSNGKSVESAYGNTNKIGQYGILNENTS
jgi:hypothetical protein